MSSRIIHNSTFTSEECGSFLGISGATATPNYSGIQKLTINTADGFCYSPYGQVSNIDCPEWDPACNCYIGQYRPGDPMKTDKELFDLKLKTNECVLIQQELPNIGDYGTKTGNHFGWWGIDFYNSRCLYNCKNEETPQNPGFLDSRTKPRLLKVKHYGITGALSGKYLYPYSLGLSGISGAAIYSKDHISSRDDINPYTITPGSDETDPVFDYNEVTYGDEISPTHPRINGPLFKYYLEYSKTNATFWNTPEKTPLLRAALMSLYQYEQVKLVVNGDSRVKIGCMVNIYMPISGEGQSDIKDKRFAGSWMVYRIERNIMPNKHTMVIYLMRDGTSNNNYANPKLNKYGNTTYASENGDSPKGY